MAKIEIYTTKICPFCHAAKSLLQQKQQVYEEIDVSQNQELRAAMSKRAQGRNTVPQIFINDIHIGGCDDLYALDARGGLDEHLKS